MKRLAGLWLVCCAAIGWLSIPAANRVLPLVTVEAFQQSATPVLAIKGFDPIHLVAGREEAGKPDIFTDHKGYRYRFASEANRRTFTADPKRYSIQNDSCLVVPGAPLDATLFAVHQGRIYGFATPDCVVEFKARPDSFVKP